MPSLLQPRTRISVIASALIGALLLGPAASVVRAQDQMLTLEELFDPAARRTDFYGFVPTPRWVRSGMGSSGNGATATGGPRYLETRRDARSGGAQLVAVDPKTGQAEPYIDTGRIVAALAALPGIGDSTAQMLARQALSRMNAAQTAALLEYDDDLIVVDIAAGKAVRVTRTPDDPERNASLSPDARRVAFVKNNNLYVAEVASPGQEKALTTDGGENILNGRLDWVYEEEVYGRGNTTGYKWSPDSKRIAFLRLDETPVRPFVVVDHLPRLQETETMQYPKAGDPNPIVRLGVATVDGSAPVRFVETSKYPDDNRLIVRFGWTPDSAMVVYQVQNRIQSWLDLNTADPQTGKPATLFRETSPAWVEVTGEPTYLADGSFLWLSDRTGHRHVYRYRPDGTLVGAVTTGEWDVRDLHGVDEKNGFVYFSGTAQSALANHAYRVRLDGTGGLTRLTTERGDSGTHSVSFDPTFTFFFDNWSDAATPPQVRLHAADDGKMVRLISDNPTPRNAFARYKTSRPEFVQVKARDGFILDAMLIKPVDFDPAKKYPVFCPVYGGPGGGSVRDAWDGGRMWYQYLAQNGYIVWIVENRLAGAKGAKAAYSSYKNLGAGELRDIEDGLDWLVAKGFADPARVAIEGWSYGGYLVGYALTHSKRFKVGIAGAGVYDWQLYDTIYTERYMDTPEANPDGYRKSAPIHAAANLSGKLLLVHGTMDDNVHLQNTIQFAYALQRAGKDFQMMLYPRSRHGVGDPLLSWHLRQLTVKFLKENL